MHRGGEGVAAGPVVVEHVHRRGCRGQQHDVVGDDVALADDDVKLAPMLHSPVLQREGVERRWEDDAQAPLMEEWRKGRTSSYGTAQLKKRDDVEAIDARELLAGAAVAELTGLGEGPHAQLWPHLHGTDGMFLALLRKKG